MTIAVTLMCCGNYVTAAAMPSAAGASKVVNSKPKGRKVKTRATNSFATPDFAYPKTVDKNASAAYESALQKGDGATALLAAIQMCIAQNEIDKDSVEVSLRWFDDLSHCLPAPWSQLAMLLEAKLYAEIYQSDSYLYDNRQLPLTPRPERVSEWSADLFAEVIESLVGKAAAQTASSGNSSIGEIKGVLTNTSDAIKAGMTVADFIDMKGADILEMISPENSVPLRFGDATGAPTPREKSRMLRSKLIEEGISRTRQSGNVQICSLFCYDKLNSIGYDKKRREFLKECFEEFGDTNWGARFVGDYCADMLSADSNAQSDAVINSNRRKALEILDAYAARFPKAPGLNNVLSQISSLRTKSVDFRSIGNILPGSTWKCSVSAANIYDYSLLVYRVPDTYDEGSIGIYKVNELAAKIPVRMSGTAPDIAKDTIEMPALKPGKYAIFPSADGTKKGILKDAGDRYVNSSVVQVTGLSYVMIQSPDKKDVTIVVTRAANMDPVADARVEWNERVYRGNARKVITRTDAQGMATLPTGSGDIIISKGNDRLDNNFYSYGMSNDTQRQLTGRILTDLSIYKPGQSVKFAGILMSRIGNTLRSAADSTLRFELLNANYQVVDTLSLVTDSYGRVNGSFILPTDGLLGRYSLVMKKDDRHIESATFQVAEYKSPTFMVEAGAVGENYKLGDVLKLEGRAVTYSGMPVSGAKVDYTVAYQPWWAWWRGAGGSGDECSGTTVTDAKGNYKIELPTGTLRDTPYERGTFTVQVSVTNAAGETQQSAATRFSLGSAYNISAPDKLTVCVGRDTVPARISVLDMTGRNVSRKVYYAVKSADNGAVVSSGELTDMSFMPDYSSIASGEYKVTFSLNPDMKGSEECANAEMQLIVYRPDDRRPPVSTSLWVPVTTVNMNRGEKSAKVDFGSSYDNSSILVLVDNGRRLLEKKWVRVSDGMISKTVDAPAADERIFVTLMGMHDGELNRALVQVIPMAQQQKVEIEAETFRDKLDPGAREEWKFRFTVGGKPMASRPAMAVMSNKALNALSPFRWNFNPYGSLSWTRAVSCRDFHPDAFRGYFAINQRYDSNDVRELSIPGWNTYGQSLYNSWLGVKYSVMSTSRNALYMNSAEDECYDMAEAPAAEGVTAGAAPRAYKSRMMKGADADGIVELEEEKVEDASEDAGDNGGEEPLREVECPLAFFMPDLMTDADGVAALQFTVPEFNGTWQFQIAGYDAEMRGAVKVLDAVASKKVMVQMNAPRFLRTGDKAQISATLYNNSGAALPVGGSIVIANMEGQILARRQWDAEELPVGGQRVVTIDVGVPANVSQISVRAYAEGGGHRDGEGTAVAVLPSSTPVLDSKTFYAGPGEDDIKAEMPANAKDATVTLQYCGNPIWECITALPQILTPDSENILSLVDALYGNAIASGLVRQYPQIGEALKTFAAPENAADSTLVSNLQKNEQIKNVKLNNTPWVNNAADETRRMSSLIEYTDAAKADKAVADIVSKLTEKQNNDGSWSWCDGMPGSTFITGRVLLHLAMLNGMGYMPEGADRVIDKAFGYVDRELVKEWKRSTPRTFSVNGMMNYLYVKSFFPDVRDAGDFGSLRKAAMKAIASDWKNFDIYDKATAATLEWRKGDKTLAGDMLESVRQFASVNAENGMWFANLKGYFSGWNPLITTAQVLEAYNEISPASEDVDKLRQWLLMSKQVQDWGAERGTAEVVQAILSSGHDWTVPSAPADVTIAGKPIAVPHRSAIVDSFTLTLTLEQTAAGDIRIHKHSAGPAWGGVVSQYVAPILDVKDVSVPQLSVRKEVYSLRADDDGNMSAVAGELKVGDKVRVTLTITADRDMDYISVTDARSACLETVGQISGYTSSDGVWFYREMRNSATNLFIPFLSKGTHVISYECYVDRAGEYTLGIAAAQSQYAPVIAAHSKGIQLKVK